ncbi:hypothetical protein Agub_g10998 [Astrephomene gubernaculifera]|uniref:phenylalanine--tRNA ligase n=1 Tax=Astrephomene gubernaculifera TaxID=47775 RepID=A0AAD3HQK0_9CHLO|nr:hypothetical protein Agub_g10998 [Astrephomene gubernaculifera]
MALRKLNAPATAGRLANDTRQVHTVRPILVSAFHGRVCPLAFKPASKLGRTHAVAPACVAAPVELKTGKPRREDVITGSPDNNVTDYIYEKMGMDLHRQADHPIGIIKQAIYDYFESRNPGLFQKFDDRYPIVSTRANFDEVLVPADHVSRSPNDTYYVNANTVLRCHTSAHQAETLRAGHPAFLVTGDVYRRDSIDATHYPVFHQMEGVRVFSEHEWTAAGLTATQLAEKDLKGALEGLAKHLFGDVECRWIDAYFPFTEPSFELEIFFKGKWLEVLGCGVMQQIILDDNYKPGHKAWAFGLGLERLAMVLFDVPDIRLFWSNDDRFLKQFRAGDLSARFKPYSKFPACYKDMAFWVSPEFSENNLCELVRNIGGDLVEEVTCIDTFTNKKTGRTSNCFRITYRSMERSLTDEEINALQERVRQQVASELKVELR